MSVVQTIARGHEGKKFLSLAPLSALDEARLEQAMEKQLALVSHALIRGQDLPQLGDPGFSMLAADLNMLRRANINVAVQPKNPPPGDSSMSLFEKIFGTIDISELILKQIDLLDLKTLAAVSRTCRETIGSYRRTWDLGQMLFGLCDLVAASDDEARKIISRLGNVVWVHGRDAWDTERLRQPLDSDSDFAMDANFLGHPNAAIDLVTSTLATYYQGKAFQRKVKFNSASKRDKVNAENILKTAIAFFRKIPDSRKSNIYYCKLDRIQPMLVSFAQHGVQLRRVHFDNVPFFDIRILAVALETLPSLEDLVVESCELLHLGKLVTILDLLYWIGVRRDRKFINFDFFPKAWFGPLKQRTATSVLTFNPPIDNEHPRIVMAAVITAVMKAWSMDLDIIRSGSLLEKFLLLVPMEFGLMALFLKHLRQYAAICRIPVARRTEEQVQTSHHNIHQILGAVNRPVYSMRFEGIRQDDFNISTMHKTLRECCDCKSKVYRFLIKPSQWHGSSGGYTCSACLLTPMIEADDHAWLDDKRRILGNLLGEKAWNDEPDGEADEKDDEDCEIPHPFDQVCPTIGNKFVWAARPEKGKGMQWLQKMEANFWYGKYASKRIRELHQDAAAWEHARLEALWLDAKNRFAADALGMPLDDPENSRQPYRQHSLAERTWEGTYEMNLAHQGQELVLDEEDNMNWRSVRDIFIC